MIAALVVALACSLLTVSAKTVTYDFDIGWLQANPDGLHRRPVIGINGNWPIPTIEANLGDKLRINVKNSLGNETTSLHFHGLFQQDSANNDGIPMVTQCPITPGQAFTYEMTAYPAGTFWYHSHSAGQYPDGLRGALIVHDKDRERKLDYEKEYLLTTSDWCVLICNSYLTPSGCV